MTAPALTEARRRVFAALADVLIPEALGMPAASAVGVAGAPLDHVLSLRPDLVPALLRGLDAATAGEGPDALAERLNRDDPGAIGAIGLAASAAYYRQPEVRRRLGYPGQAQRPVRDEEWDDFLRDGLLDPVIARGPIYRPTPR